MRSAGMTRVGGCCALVVAVALGGCGKIRQKDPQQVEKEQARAKLQKAACASPDAYQRLKGLLFDQAIRAHAGDRANLDVLADYSVVRMEDPVVKAWDPSLDITRCKGRFILELPPGAERGFGGARRLEAQLDYSAQAAADGSGFVYQQKGAEPIIARLAAFDLTSGAYRPPPAIDQQGPGPLMTPPPAQIASADAPAPAAKAVPAQAAPRAAPAAPAPGAGTVLADKRSAAPPPRRPATSPVREAETHAGSGGSGEEVIRAFYGALGAGDGAAAATRIIPEKRSSGAFSPAAMSRFYGRLAEPIRLTGIVPLAGGAYRVSYRYSPGRSHCNGSAVVRLTDRGGRALIRSIQALNGC